MDRSPKVVPCPSVTLPILHSSSRARKRTMTSMRVRQSRTRARNDAARCDSGTADQLGDRLGHRDGVHGDVREVDPRHRPLGATRAGRPGPRPRAVMPASRSGAWTTKSSSSPTSRGWSATPVRPGRRRRRPRRRTPGTRAAGPAADRAPPTRSGPPRRPSPRGPGSSFCDFSSIRMAATSRNSDSWLKSIRSRCSERTVTKPSTTGRSGMSRTSTSWEDTRCNRRSIGPSKTGVETA